LFVLSQKRRRKGGKGSDSPAAPINAFGTRGRRSDGSFTEVKEKGREGKRAGLPRRERKKEEIRDVAGRFQKKLPYRGLASGAEPRKDAISHICPGKGKKREKEGMHFVQHSRHQTATKIIRAGGSKGLHPP